MNSLRSALEAPKTAFRGEEMYPSLFEKTAAYLYHLVRNHPFNDGNKRTAYVVVLVFLKANGAPIHFKMKDLEQIVVETAAGKFDKAKLTVFFKEGKT